MTLERSFAEDVESAYEHLYDLVYLGNHPLAELLLTDFTTGRKDNGWRLHRVLLNAIEDLKPGPSAPTFSREWRRHRLLTLRFIDGMVPETVASQLAVSRRQYYRLLSAALDALTEVLRERCVVEIATPPNPSQVAGQPESPSHLELLRREAARMAQANRYCRLEDVLDGVLSVLEERFSTQHVAVTAHLPDTVPDLAVDRSLFRQLLLAILGSLTEGTQSVALHFSAEKQEDGVYLTIEADRPIERPKTPDTDETETLLALDELAGLNKIRLTPVRPPEGAVPGSGPPVTGFVLRIPTQSERSVLVIDDNEDVLELYGRYLSLHAYHAVTARTAQEALAAAQQQLPFAIILDLMMPGKDGWDLLQSFLNHAETQHVPILVCSVLRQKQLALSLGATMFLEKPVSEQQLLAALETLIDSEP
ncbi:MAG TPA: response regulator [Aggregatilineales bacterium]|nr:response regulator [Aggregatilineales bacterium]